MIDRTTQASGSVYVHVYLVKEVMLDVTCMPDDEGGEKPEVLDCVWVDIAQLEVLVPESHEECAIGQQVSAHSLHTLHQLGKWTTDEHRLQPSRHQVLSA